MNSKADVLTERVEMMVADGSVVGGYLARPAASGPRPGVLVAHELFGVTSHIREVCERLAGSGYVALAPDFYHRAKPGTELAHDAAGRERGFELLGLLDRPGVLGDADAAYRYLKDFDCARVAMVGLSLGGHIGYLAATALPLAAVVAAYPGWLAGTEIGLSRPEPTLALTPGIRGRVLVLCGEADHAISGADLAAAQAALAGAGVAHEIVTYPGVAHGFLCDRRDSYDPVAAADAWARIDALLERELGGPGAASLGG
jgi:carboxymethylenebutenolidase